MKHFPISLFALSLVSASVDAAPSSRMRDFHPLVAKIVRIETAGTAKSGSRDAFLSEGWARFDAKEWGKAVDQFLSALEVDSSSQAAAEGLTMSVYCSGDVASAAALGEEFSQSMPKIRHMVAEAILADARKQIERGELVALKEYVKFLPQADGAYDDVRGLLEAASWEKIAAEKGAVAQRGE